MTSITELRTQILLRVNRLRSLQRMIALPQFEGFWARLTFVERSELMAKIQGYSIRELKTKVKEKMDNFLSVRELHHEAKKMGILNYSRLSRSELLEALYDSDWVRTTNGGNSSDLASSNQNPQEITP